MTTSPALGVLLTATAALVLLGACADGGSSGRRDSARPPSPAPVPSPSPTFPEDLAVTPSGRATVLTGEVDEGVESGCLLLQASGVLHLLVGAVQGLAPGQRVTVEGRPDPGLLTTCQQGTPFVVTSWRPA